MVEPIETAEVPLIAGDPGARNKSPSRRGRRGRVLIWIAGCLVVVLIGLGIAAQIAMDRAEPILLARVIETLSTRYDSRVELDHFHVSVVRGFEAEGNGLRLYPRRFLATAPLISIANFSFRVSWASVFHSPMHVGQVTVEGMTIDIPPKEEREATSASAPVAPAPASQVPGHQPGIKIYVDEVIIRNVRLLVRNGKPGKLPLDFEISRVVLHSVGPGQPMRFEATLVNPKPIGNIQSSGYFGPFQQENPGETPVRGSYSFTHADLATFKGIGGILSSSGKYAGPLNQLVVDGEASVPEFRLDTGNHPMPLHTIFHAVVDGTSGDTYLRPVEAQLGRSSFTVNGSVVKVPGPYGTLHGHDITLDVAMDRARIEDFLKLAVNTVPPVMNGNLSMRARIYLPPGNVPVTDKLRLNGNFEVSGAYFSSDKIQEKIDLLSQLGQGHPKDPDLHVSPPPPEVKAPADVKGDVLLNLVTAEISSAHLKVPVKTALIGDRHIAGR